MNLKVSSVRIVVSAALVGLLVMTPRFTAAQADRLPPPFCSVAVKFDHPDELSCTAIQNYADTFRTCTLRRYYNVCLESSPGSSSTTNAEEREENAEETAAWCQRAINQESLTPTTFWEEYTARGDGRKLPMGRTSNPGEPHPWCGPHPIEDCRWIGETPPTPDAIREDEWVEAMTSCHVQTNDRPVCTNPTIIPLATSYYNAELITLADEYSTNAEDFTGNYTYAQRHDFAILAAATAKHVDLLCGGDAETHAVRARAEAAWRCTSMWDAVLHGTAFDVATAHAACPKLYPADTDTDLKTETKTKAREELIDPRLVAVE